MIGSTARRVLLAAIAFAAMVGASTVPAAGQSLIDALVQAYTSNPQLLAARASLRAVDEELPRALSGWRPTVIITGQAGQIESRTDGGFADGGFQGSVDSSLSNLAGTLTVTQPLYRGGRTVAEISRAKNQIQAARAQLFSTEQLVLAEAVLVYTNVWRDQAVLDLNINNERVLERQLEATRDRFEVGELTRTDVAQAESRLARGVADRITAEGSLATSRASYERVIGSPPGSLNEPPPFTALPATLDQAIAIALANNPSIAAAQFALEAAQDDVEVALSVLRPNLALVGELSAANELAFEDQETESAAIVAQLTVPLYQSGAEYAQVRQFREIVGQRQLELDLARRRIIDAAVTAWEVLVTSRALIDALVSNVEAQLIALEGVQQEADFGVRTTLDVLDAEQELFDAQVSLVIAQRDEVVAAYGLAAAVGGLTAEQLALPVEYYDVTDHFEQVKDRWFGTD